MESKKALIGFVVALILFILISILNEYVLIIKIPEFLKGWFCCMAYEIGRDSII